MQRYLFSVFDTDGIELGQIFKDEYGFITKPFYGDIGHEMIDTFNEAVQDILQCYHETTGKTIHPFSSFKIKKKNM